MKTMRRIPWLLMPVILTIPAPSAAAEKLIELIPDTAFAAVLIERPQRFLTPKQIEPIFGLITDSKTDAGRLVDAWKSLKGRMLLGAAAPPPKKDVDSDFFVAIEWVGSPEDLDELVKTKFLPAISILYKLPPGHRLELEQGKTATRVLEMPGGKARFAYAVKGRVVLGATRPEWTLRWVRGEWPPRRWVSMPGVRRMLKGLPEAPSARVLVNPTPLLKNLEKPKSNRPEELALKILAPQDVQAAALDITCRPFEFSARLTIALAEECAGLARVLTRPPSDARVLGVFPADFLAVGRVGWGSAADLVDGVYTLSDQFDETISAEYREELAEFRQQSGVAWDTGILGNLVGEMALGLRVDFTRKEPIGWAAVFPLADATDFRRQLDLLIDHFGLTFKPEDYAALPVQTAVGTVPFSLGISGNLLIVAGDAQTVVDVAAQSRQGKQAVPKNRNLRTCYESLGEPNQLAVMLDIEQLRKSVPILPLAVGPVFAPLFAQGSMGMAMTVEERLARVDFRWSLRSAGKREKPSEQAPTITAEGADVLVKLATGLTASLQRARELSCRTISSANMRSVGQALYIYAQGHKGAFPESLEALVRASPDSISLSMLTSPYDGRGPKSVDEVNRRSYVVYRPGFTTSGYPGDVLLAERELSKGEGANFLFLDAHVEFVPEPRASEMLKLIAEGAKVVRK